MTAYTSVDELFRHVRDEKKNAVGEYRAAQQEHLRLTGSENEILKQKEQEKVMVYNAKLDRLEKQYRQFRDLMALTDTELVIRSANVRLGLLNEDEAVQQRVVTKSDYWSVISNGNGITGWNGIQALAEEYVTIKNDTSAGTATHNRTLRQRKIVNRIVTDVMPYIKQLAEEMRHGRYDKGSKTYGHGPVKLGENWIMLGKKASVEDLVQNGAAHAVEHFDKYDPARGRFSTWLVLFARAGMTQGFWEENNQIGMGAGLFWYARKVLHQYPGQEDFIQAITDRSTDELWKRHRRISPARATLIYFTLTGKYRDIGESRRRDNDNASIGSLETVLTNENAQLPDEETMNNQLVRQTQAVLTSLTPRERKVLELRFGIGTDHDKTMEEVGNDFKVTRERIRQIEAKALTKLRHPSQTRPVRNAAW